MRVVNLPVPHERRRRPSRGPLARRDLVEALHVSAEGRVVPGQAGYYWYGEWFALSTTGAHAAEYLLGGASVPPAALVALAAVLDARRHLIEWPDQPLSEEWARCAWGVASYSQPLTEYARERLGERAWPIYRAALQAAFAEMSPRW